MKVIEKHKKSFAFYEQFLEFSPYDFEALDKARSQLENRSFDRDWLYQVLKKYNQSICNDDVSFQNIESIKNTQSVFVITGQQLGLMGGPAYTILKCLKALMIAKETGAIPLFWAATEDHDVDEIDHTYLLDDLGNLQKFHLTLPKEGRFVEDLYLSDHNKDVLSSFLELVNLQSFDKELTQATSYSQFMMEILVSMFKGTGLVFFEPKILRDKAIPFFKKEIQVCEQIVSIISKTTDRLVTAGGKAAFKPECTNLFLKIEGGFRKKIRKINGDFLVGKESFNEKELLDLIESHPERFSTNVAARPVLQSLIIPTLAYVAGPNELKYHGQLKNYFDFHGVAMPWITPRFSATFISSLAKNYLEKMKLKPWDEIPNQWREVMPKLEDGVDQLKKKWQQSAYGLYEQVHSKETIGRYVKQSIRKLSHKITVSKLQEKNIPSYALHYVRTLISPQQKPQERVLNFWEFQKQSQKNLIQEFLKHVNWKSQGHLYCYYE